MATSPKIKYDIEAAVSGGSDVGALATQLEGLANTLEGDLKVQAQASAQALRELGAKQGAIENFRVLKTEVGSASAQLKQAQSAAQQLGEAMAATSAPTKAQAGQMQQLRDAVRAAKTELQTKTAALEQGRTALRTYGVGTTDLYQKERQVTAALAATRAQVATMAPAYAAAGRAAATAGAQQAQGAKAASSELENLSAQLRNIQGIAAAALGGTFVGGLAKDLAATADQYNNLAARIKLVTGEGAAFQTAFEGVQAIALRTNSELEGTATLFTRLAQAGKELGLSQATALSLTETINQSIQLSGGSADSAKAAIIQLVQGLQSGVLRGEEFNSIMEQSPRLARALADGLGVTTGELRNLANQGSLTTEVVLNALQGQGAAIATEFEKLPPTVGRALQNLSTSWTVYVGEVDKATGASTTAAQAISALANNLSTIAGLLIDVGQAGAAFVALRLAQSFTGLGTAAKVAAVEVAASTAAIKAADAAAGTAAGAGAGLGRFATLLGSLKTFGLLAIITNFKDIGTWIGESAAKLAGYKDRTEELAAAEKAAAQISQENAQAKAAMAQAMQLAADKARGLTPEAKAITAEFDKLQKGGKGVADSLEGIAKNANLSDTKGIQAFSIAMADLGKEGKASGDQIREAFANALKGQDLAAFEVRARLALSGTKGEAEQLATVLDASLREAIRRSGADFAVISGGMGAAARSAINDTELIISNLDRLKAQGVDTAAALTASIGRGIQTADGQAAIAALRQQVELVRKALGDKVADGLLAQIEEQAKKSTSALNGLDEALKKLGITSDTSLKKAAVDARNLYQEIVKNGGSAREVDQAFKKMADAAIASGDAGSIAFLKSQASARGLEVAVDETGKTIVRAMGSGKKATEEFNKGLDDSKTKVQEVITYLDRLEKRNAAVKSTIITDKDKFAVDGSGNRITQQVENRQSVAARLKSMGVEEAKANQLAASLYNAQGAYTPRSSGVFRSNTDTLDVLIERLAAQYSGKSGAAAVGRSVTVNINTKNGPESVDTDEKGAQTIVRVLRSAGLASVG